MDPVSNVSQLVAILRKQLAESQNKPNTSANVSPPPKSALTSGRLNIDELQRKTREKIGRLDPSDPKVQHKSIRIFLESVLTWQFGESLIEDPKFYGLLEDVQNAIESDPDVCQNLTNLIAKLR